MTNRNPHLPRRRCCPQCSLTLRASEASCPDCGVEGELERDMPTLEPSTFYVEPMRQRMRPQAQEANSSQKRAVAETVPLCIAPCVPLCAQPTCDSSEALTLKRPRKTDESHGASKIVNSERAEVCAADSATVQFTDACHATLLYKTRAGSLVRCPPQRVNEDADELDPQP